MRFKIDSEHRVASIIDDLCATGLPVYSGDGDVDAWKHWRSEIEVEIESLDDLLRLSEAFGGVDIFHRQTGREQFRGWIAKVVR